jgi:hypothetical protein
LLCLGLVVGLNAISIRVEPEAESLESSISHGLKRLADSRVRTINLGGSVATALRLEGLGMKGVDFVQTGMDLAETEEMLKVAVVRAPQLETVFIAADPITILTDNAWLSPPRRRYVYRALAPYRGWPVIGTDWSNLVQTRFLPLIRSDRWEGPISHLLPQFRKPSTETLSPQLALTMGHRERLLANYAIFQQATYIIRNGKYYDLSAPNRNAAIIERMCRDLKKRRIKLVFYTTPITDFHYKETKSLRMEALPVWNSTMEKCKAMGAIVLRFDTDADFQTSYGMYLDAVHLNEAGSIRFTREVAERLSKL